MLHIFSHPELDSDRRDLIHELTKFLGIQSQVQDLSVYRFKPFLLVFYSRTQSNLK